MRGPIKLINSHSGLLKCCVCHSQHWASIRPGGGFYRGSWQCPNEGCLSNRKLWSAKLQRLVKPNWRTCIRKWQQHKRRRCS
jgi:hypothetical protein